MERPYVAQAARGIRRRGPAIDIDCPVEPAVIAERDADCPDLERAIP